MYIDNRSTKHSTQSLEFNDLVTPLTTVPSNMECLQMIVLISCSTATLRGVKHGDPVWGQFPWKFDDHTLLVHIFMIWSLMESLVISTLLKHYTGFRLFFIFMISMQLETSYQLLLKC